MTKKEKISESSERLAEFVAKANVRFLGAAELGLLNHLAMREVTPQEVAVWLKQVEHFVSGHHKNKRHNHATAYNREQQIRYNPHYVVTADDELLLDLVLHELGHLFFWYFHKRCAGHKWEWKALGLIVGYAYVGSTSDERRRLYIRRVEEIQRTRSHEWLLATGRFNLRVERTA